MEQTRDQKTAEQIGKAQEFVGQLQETLRAFSKHAQDSEAVAHSKLYEAVEVELDKAWKALGAAYDIMSDGDPEDFNAENDPREHRSVITGKRCTCRD